MNTQHMGPRFEVEAAKPSCEPQLVGFAVAGSLDSLTCPSKSSFNFPRCASARNESNNVIGGI